MAVRVDGGDNKKRRLSHDNLPFINLKSNTMKNTVQMYVLFSDAAMILLYFIQ